MESAAGVRGHDLHITIFHCPRCCGGTAAAAGHGCRLVEACWTEVDGARLASAFLDGADGVLVLGCLGGACLRPRGDVEAFHHLHQGAVALSRLGIEPARLQRHWLVPREAMRIPSLLVSFRRRLHVLGARHAANGTVATPIPAMSAAGANGPGA